VSLVALTTLVKNNDIESLKETRNEMRVQRYKEFISNSVKN